MRIFTLLILLSLSFTAGYSQRAYIVFKKRNKTIASYWKGSVIAFQLKNKDWQKGEITDIRNDSFYTRPVVVKYHIIGTDTLHYSVLGYSIADIYAMPKRAILIDFRNGHWEVSPAGGHVHWYWVKSGWIFRVGAVGYTALNVINGAIVGDLSFANYKKQFIGAAAFFGFGVILHKLWKPYLRTGKKYHIKIINF